MLNIAKQILKKRKLLLLLILFLAFFFRFYNIGNWTFFGMDQEYEALIVKNIITGKHFPLIGVNASDTGLYLGPAFLYFAAVPFWLFGGDPLGWSFTASLTGILTTYTVYFLGKRMFSEKVGLGSALFYAGSFLVSFYDRQFWNPVFLPFFSLLTGYFLLEILKNNTKNVIRLALVFGFSIQCHLSILIFVPLIGWVLWKKRKHIRKRTVIVSLIIFLLLQTPILLFELRHNFINTKAFMNLLALRNEPGRYTNLQERSQIFLSTLGRFYSMRASPDLFVESGQCTELADYRKNTFKEGIILVVFSIGFFFFQSFRKRENRFDERISTENVYSKKLIFGIVILTLLYLLFYNRQVFEYYFLFLFPWLALILGWTAVYFWQIKRSKYIAVFMITVFLLLNVITLVTAGYSYSYFEKKAAALWVKKEIGNSPYSLEALGECPRFGGYRYLFEYYTGIPVRSYMDSYFDWLYKDKDEQRVPEKNTVLLSLIDFRLDKEKTSYWQEQKINMLKQYKILSNRNFGKIGVYILSPLFQVK